MRKRQEKNIYIQPPRNILLQFFFLLTSKPRYQKNIQIFTSDGSRILEILVSVIGSMEVLWTGEKGFRQVEERFSSFFPFLYIWALPKPMIKVTSSDTNIYKNGNIFDFTSSKINFDRSTYNFFSPKCLQICTYSSKRYASIFPN